MSELGLKLFHLQRNVIFRLREVRDLGQPYPPLFTFGPKLPSTVVSHSVC